MRKIVWISFSIICVIGLLIVWLAYTAIWGPNVQSDQTEITITIPSNSSFEDLMTILDEKELLNNQFSFKWLAKKMNYVRDSIPSGKFLIEDGWSNRQLISILRAGSQKPVELTFNQLRTVDQLAGQISTYIEADSLSILNTLMDQEVLSELGYTPENIMSLFIPNTYQVYWNTSPQNLLKRLQVENDAFWAKKNRREKAKSLGLSTQEVYTLASIVEKESLVMDEKPIIAGVYLNRLKKGMLLQADPTVVFAVGDFSIQRVLNKHLAIDSPYNTYKNVGLPPGPICMPSISSIDGVLNAEKHNYIFFCAKPNSGGRHAFANTLAGHNRNAAIYRNWLQANQIR